MLRAVIYCRCSTEEEAQQDALAQQVQESRRSVRQQGWLLVDEYIEAKSGTTTTKRKEYNRLCEDLEKDKFDIIQIKTQDRLMRNTKDWYLFIDRLLTNEKRLYIYLEQKFYTPDDALITGIKAILAEEFSKELSKKINNAHYHRQRDGGKYILPSQTYGLKKNPDGEIILVEEEVRAIKEIFHLCKKMGCNSIAHYLEESGFRDRNGKPFKTEAIRKIIRNPIRCGTVVQNQRHYDFQSKKMIRMPEQDWVIHKNVVPAAVTEAEWREANDAMDQRAEKGNRNRAGGKAQGRYKGKYVLSGKIRCGECGSLYYRKNRRKKIDGMPVAEWCCRRYLENGRNQKRRENLRKTERSPGKGCDNIHLEEDSLFRLLEKLCGKSAAKDESDDFIIIEKTMSVLRDVLRQNDGNSQVNLIQKELEKCEGQNQKLLDKLLTDVISDQDYKRKRAEIEDKIHQLKEKQNQFHGKENPQLLTEQRLQRIRKRLEAGAVRQAIMEEIVESIEIITVFPGKLQITFQENTAFWMDEQTLEKSAVSAEKRQALVIYDVPLEEDFSYASQKEAECRRIIEYMAEDPTITARQIALKEEISLSAAQARIRKLKRKGKVFFDGKGGHGQWVICEDNKMPKCHYPLAAQDLTGVDDQISQSTPGSKKFPDNYPDQTQPDIYLHITDDRRNRTG